MSCHAQGLSREALHKDRYWGGMQRLGGTLSHMLKEVPVTSLDLSPVTVPLAAPSPPSPVAWIAEKRERAKQHPLSALPQTSF